MANGDLNDIGGAFERSAERTRRRYPTREPDPVSLAASRLPWSAFLPSEERALQSAASLQAGGDYDPRDVFLGAIGAVGAPALGPAQGVGTLGSGLIRRAQDLIGLSAFPTSTPRKILKEAKAGGYSVRLPTGEIPTEGFMSGIYRNEDPRTLVIEGRKPTLADIGSFAERNLKALQLPERHLGAWVDPETGATYLDVSQRIPEIRPATKFAERTAQKSIFDVGAKTTRPVGNWEEFIQSPEFHQRMNQMAERGGEYLSKFPQREWWDMYGSPFEEVYGTQRLPQVAGLTASTAPNTSPIPNLMHMSEYMRRHIRGEPIVQPEWRAPEGLMNLAPGSQMPLEASRVANLVKAARGDLDALSRRKVRSEAMAMMGDPEAVVLDRQWARLAEDPERGIYTASEPATISAEPRVGKPSDYELAENEVVLAARRQERSPRNYSADAWTGIRDTIQKTGQLFGQDLRKQQKAILGESKSYADHFVDVINRKAAHLRMTPKELHKRLEGGDASLLSIMLGAPTIAGAYAHWAAGQGQNGSASSAENRASEQSLQRP